MTIEVKLNTDGLDELIKESPLKVDAAVRATAFFVEAIAKTMSPVATGANRSSIYTKTSQGVNGSPGELGDILPGVQMGEAVIGPSMGYSVFLEFGTSKMPARPYLTPAAEQAPKYFVTAIQQAFE
jgi:HK97 gp10 family phage protein